MHQEIEDISNKTTKEFTLNSYCSVTQVSDKTVPFLSDMNPDDIPTLGQKFILQVQGENDSKHEKEISYLPGKVTSLKSGNL